VLVRVCGFYLALSWLFAGVDCCLLCDSARRFIPILNCTIFELFYGMLLIIKK
jgi:hypothetical protein